MQKEASTKSSHLNRATDDLKITRRCVEKAFTLPVGWYTSQEHYELEMERIFLRDWICVGRADEVVNPGDYFTLDIASEPIVVVRDEKGKVRAFSSVCRHRAALVVEGQGNSRKFVCPFHGWTYSLRGELFAAPFMNKIDGFDRRKWCLPDLAIDEWEGFVFVNFDRQANPMSPRLKGLSEKLRNYRISEMVSTKRLLFENQCNWKLSVEQGVDMYHVPWIHPEAAPPYLVSKTLFDDEPEPAYTMSFTPMEKPHPYITGTAMAASPFPAIDGLNNFELQSFNLVLIHPTAVLGFNPDGMLYLLFYPRSPNRTAVVLNLCYPLETLRLPDFSRHLKDAQDGFIELNYQDMRGAKLAQMGMSSRFAVRGRYSHLERTTWDLNQYVVSRLGNGRVLSGEGGLNSANASRVRRGHRRSD